jgi:Periplasmic copper-binding protein (NosD)
MLFAPALCLADATVIDSVPSKITVPGNYILKSDLTAQGSDGIEIQVSNVTLDLNGYTLAQAKLGSGTGTGTLDGNNIIIKNGTVSGFGNGVFLSGNHNIVENVRVIKAGGSITFQGNHGLIQDCYIAGKGSGSIGILINGDASGLQIKNNQISNAEYGVFGSTAGACAIIRNYISNCKFGLNMSPNTKYLQNITTDCNTPFKGGIPVGDENN